MDWRLPTSSLHIRAAVLGKHGIIPRLGGQEAKSRKRFCLVEHRDTYSCLDYSMTLEQSFHDHRMIVPRSRNNQFYWAHLPFYLYVGGHKEG